MSNHEQEKFIVDVLNRGYHKAANSFSKLVGKQVQITNAQSLIVRNQKDCSFISEEKGELFVYITQLIGDLSGKSFLIFNEEERDDIFRELSKDGRANLTEAFLYEIDNIVSASVISEISNAFNIEVYGDVPHLVKIQANALQKYICGDTGEADPSSIIFSNTTFHLGHHERVHPQFIWKFRKRIFEMIPVSKILM